MRKNKLHLTRKEAKARSVAVWEYLADHPEAEKESLPKKLMQKIANCLCGCPLCELYWERDKATGNLICTEKCPLSARGECCGDTESLFNLWASLQYDLDDAQDRCDGQAYQNLLAERQGYAQGILDIIKDWEV